MKLSIIIPAFNEIENLKKGVLEEIEKFLTRQKFSYKVLIVDDGSTDGSKEFIEKSIKGYKSFSLIKNNHGGKAIAVMTGLLDSKGDIGLFTDMDQATPISEIEKLLPYFAPAKRTDAKQAVAFDDGFDIVIGSRQGRKGAPVIRKLMAAGFALFRTIILGLPFKDTQCGFKGFNRKTINTIFPLLMERWKKHLKEKGAAVNAAFDVETLFLAKKMGFKIKEVPVSWHHVGTERVQVIKDSYDAIIDILKIRINDYLNRY